MKIMSVVGARPQFIKAACFRKSCISEGVEELLFHTGQHYDFNMSTVFFEELDVRPPDLTYDLKNRGHGGMTGELLHVLEDAFLEYKPDVVNVYGDTNTTLAAALAAVKLHIPVSHIESGLRSFNKKMPEEINRVLTDHSSDFLFCPTKTAVKNLHAENINERVYHVGDIMYDSVRLFGDKFIVPDIVKNKPNSKKLAVVTIHRAENLSDVSVLREILEYCKSYSDEYFIVFPIHPNTRNKINSFDLGLGDIEVIDPLPYLKLQGLLSFADIVLTDSGGVQKEAYFHRTPCITLRDETEWVETIDAGWNRLWKMKAESIGEPVCIDDFGGGDTASQILKILSDI